MDMRVWTSILVILGCVNIFWRPTVWQNFPDWKQTFIWRKKMPLTFTRWWMMQILSKKVSPIYPQFFFVKRHDDDVIWWKIQADLSICTSFFNNIKRSIDLWYLSNRLLLILIQSGRTLKKHPSSLIWISFMSVSQCKTISRQELWCKILLFDQ